MVPRIRKSRAACTLAQGLGLGSRGLATKPAPPTEPRKKGKTH